MPMEEGKIESETDQDPSILEVLAINWARCRCQKRAIRLNGTRLESCSTRGKQLGPSTSRKRNRTKFINGFAAANERNHKRPDIAENTSLERQQRDQIPDEYLPHEKRLSRRFGLVFIKDKIIVPKNLRTTIISLLHKGHPPSTK